MIYTDNKMLSKRSDFMELRNLVLSIVCIVFGLFMLVSGVKKLKRCTYKTVGRIIDVSISEDKDEEGYLTNYYAPKFEYEVNGQIFQGVGDKNYRSERSVKIGGNINVYYNPENPSDCYTKGGGKSQPIIGAVATVLGVAILFTSFID